MANYQFNKSTLSYNGVTFGINSFSEDGGSRAEIDITTSVDTTRKSLAGMPSTPTFTVGFVYNGERATLNTALAGCSADALSFSVGKDCATEAHITDVNYYLMGWDISGDLDGAVTGSLTFLKGV